MAWNKLEEEDQKVIPKQILWYMRNDDNDDGDGDDDGDDDDDVWCWCEQEKTDVLTLVPLFYTPFLPCGVCQLMLKWWVKMINDDDHDDDHDDNGDEAGRIKTTFVGKGGV